MLWGARDAVPALQGAYMTDQPRIEVHLQTSTLQVCLPIEQQVARWRCEVFRLLLQLAQLEQASEAQAVEAQQAAGATQQQLTACRGQLSLVQQQSVALHIDMDMLRLSTQRAEEATESARRQATATAALGCMQQNP